MKVKGHVTASTAWKLATALQRPKLTWAYLKRKSTLAQMAHSPRKLVESCYDELAKDPVAREIEENLSRHKELSLGFAGCSPELYVLTRLCKPIKIVETGVANGVSSAFFLLALHRNQQGSLFSVSLAPEKDPFVPAGKTVGWVVPTELRDRWKLVSGSSRDVLPRALADTGPIEVFFHDSDHSYDNMSFELEACWPYIKPGGYIIADDMWENEAFDDFCRQHTVTASPIRNAGIIQKNSI